MLHGARDGSMTLAQLAVTVAALGLLGLIANRFGLSAIPAYLLAGLLLGPNEPKVLSLIQPSEVTEFVAELGIVFLLFFLGLEFTLGRLARSRRHAIVGGAIDLVLNAGLGLAVGVAAFGLHFGALILGRRDLRLVERDHREGADRLPPPRRRRDRPRARDPRRRGPRDRASCSGSRAGGGGALGHDAGARRRRRSASSRSSLAASKWLSRAARPRCSSACRASSSCSPRSRSSSGWRAVAEELGLSEAIGALMAGVVLSETSVREELEERFFSFRDVFAALFFFVFGLSIDVGAIGDVGWLLAAAVAVTLVGKIGGGFASGVSGGFTRAAEPERRRGARRARRVHDHPRPDRLDERRSCRTPIQAQLVAFSGLYVLATAAIGVVLMKESKAIGRRLFRPPRLREG